ncbi:MAG TPA: alpha/beta fold hydrolase [Candidatus Saccharimonadales bacterium]|nr:alpha/beta fold hydrolase [Candidatus Saccharimonadales bacterium]
MEKVLRLENGGKIVGKLSEVADSRGLILLVHGFAGNIDGPGGTSYKKIVRLLNERNFDVFRFNFRFTDKSLKDFEKMTIAGEISDLGYIIRKFSKRYKNIGILGESLGGVISVLAYGKEIKVLVLWYPTIDITENLGKTFDTEDARRELEEKGYVSGIKHSIGVKYRVGIRFISESKKTVAYNSLRQITAPTLIISPDGDTLVRFGQSAKAIKLIRSKDKRLITIKDSDHAWWKTGRRKRDWNAERLAMKETVEWFDRYMPKN